MKRRQHKRLRDAASLAGPMYPWRSAGSMENWRRMMRNRQRERGKPFPDFVMEVGRIEGFRFIASPLL